MSNVSTQSWVQCQDICSWPTFPMLFRPVVVQLVGEGSHQFFHMNWVVLPYLAQICREEYILNICTGSSVSCGRKLHSPPLAADILGNVPGLWGGMVERPWFASGEQDGKALLIPKMCLQQGNGFHSHTSFREISQKSFSFMTWIHAGCTMERCVKSECHPVQPVLKYMEMKKSFPVDDSSR